MIHQYKVELQEKIKNQKSKIKGKIITLFQERV